MKLLLSLILIVALGFSSREDQSIDVPAELQYPLFLKALSYDRAIESKKVGHLLKVGVLFQEKYRASANAKENFDKVYIASKLKAINGIPIEIDYLPVEDQESVTKLDGDRKFSCLIVFPLRAIDIGEVSRVCQNRNITSFTPVPAYCKEGIAIGLENRGGAAGVIVNLPAAKAEGIDFSSQLLMVSRVIK